MIEPTIRSYLSTDRTAVFRIAADTAYFGEPVEAFLEDRRLFCDAFYRYYTDLEPEHGWIACVGEAAVGFLMGSSDTARQSRRVATQIVPKTIWKILRGRYRIGPRTRRYALETALSALLGETLQVDLEAYPAHLHVNLDTNWRGRGLGRRLMEAFLTQLRDSGIHGVHLHTTSQNVAACQLYERLGFRVKDTRPARLMTSLMHQPVNNLCYGLRLAPNSAMNELQ